MAIEPGTLLEATTATGETVVLRAIAPPTDGRDFPVVWVCTPDEYDRAQTEGDEPDSLPWPLHAVSVLTHA